jgi:P-type E1-E2 ATPase
VFCDLYSRREMVNLIKTGLDGVRTLAIGDGANDVAMIQAAHIGVLTLCLPSACS